MATANTDVSTTHADSDEQARIDRALTHFKGGHWKYARDSKGDVMVFCWIQKVGCTRFKKVFNDLHMQLNFANRPERHYNYKDILRDPKIHKAMFFREPMSRFLSGYLDKCGDRTRVYCVRVFGVKDITFPDAVFKLKELDPNKLDGHFHAQTKHCGGLTKEILRTVFTTVEELQDQATTRQAMQKLMQYFHLTEKQFNNIYPIEKSGHATDANEKLQRYYNDPQLVGVVVKYFLEDYRTFEIALPEFAQQALLQLWATNDPYALDKESMEALGIGFSNPHAIATPLSHTRQQVAAGSIINGDRVNGNGWSSVPLSMYCLLFLIVAFFVLARSKPKKQRLLLPRRRETRKLTKKRFREATRLKVRDLRSTAAVLDKTESIIII